MVVVSVLLAPLGKQVFWVLVEVDSPPLLPQVLNQGLLHPAVIISETAGPRVFSYCFTGFP